jgi:hypothetical protein
MLPVFVFFFFGGQGVAGRDELLNLRILGDQRWIRGLAIHKPKQALDPERLIGVATADYAFQYPGKSSVRISSSSTFAATSIFLKSATMTGDPAM